MKCSTCYADNATWAAACVMCGEPVVPVELCANGHILPPGARECPICPSMWPETPPFSGPPVLRAILYAEKGRIVTGPGAEATFLELRDGSAPLTFDQPAADRLALVAENTRDAVARLLVRPTGVSLCRKTGTRGGKIAYQGMVGGESVALGGMRVRLVAVEVPGWLASPGEKGPR